MKYTQEEVNNAKAQLKKMLKPGDTIYTLTRHVSNSGMYRSISLFCVGKDRKITCIDWLAIHILDMHIDKHDGIGISGCGMDMHFALVYDLGRTLFPKGFKVVKGQLGRIGDTSGYETDGGYAFKKESL